MILFKQLSLWWEICRLCHFLMHTFSMLSWWATHLTIIYSVFTAPFTYSGITVVTEGSLLEVGLYEISWRGIILTVEHVELRDDFSRFWKLYNGYFHKYCQWFLLIFLLKHIPYWDTFLMIHFLCCAGGDSFSFGPFCVFGSNILQAMACRPKSMTATVCTSVFLTQTYSTLK